MFGKANHSPLKPIDSLIGGGTTLTGNILFTGGLRVDGAVVGNVHAQNGEASTLVVSEQAKITGEIRVSHLSSTAKSRVRFMHPTTWNSNPRRGSRGISTTSGWKCTSARRWKAGWSWRTRQPAASSS